MRRPNSFRHAAVLGLTLLIVPGLAAPSRAQHTPDPFNIVGDGNLGYQDSMFPTYPNGVGYTPNQGVLQGRSGLSRANQFQSYLQELDGVDSGSPFSPSARGRGGIEPYYRAHRDYDSGFQKPHIPLLKKTDESYDQNQRARTEKYLEYLRESDPKKRAQLYREYNQLSLRSARESGSGSARVAARRNAASERPSTSDSALASPSTRSAPARPSATPGAGAGAFRRPSRLPSSSRLRGGPTSPSNAGTETPSQLLDRMIRESESSRAPSSPAPR